MTSAFSLSGSMGHLSSRTGASRRIHATPMTATTTISTRSSGASVGGTGQRPGRTRPSADARSVIQCQAVCRTSADAMMTPMRSSITYRNVSASSGSAIDQHQQLPELHADVEREQRRHQVRSGELQRLLQRE